MLSDIVTMEEYGELMKEEGRESGLVEGKESGLAEMILKLYTKNISIAEIVKLTDLSEDKIRGVISEYMKDK